MRSGSWVCILCCHLCAEFNADDIPVLPPVPTKGLKASDVDDLTRDIRAKMLKAIEDMAKDRGSKSVNSGAVDGVAKATGTELKNEI